MGEQSGGGSQSVVEETDKWHLESSGSFDSLQLTALHKILPNFPDIKTAVIPDPNNDAKPNTKKIVQIWGKNSVSITSFMSALAKSIAELEGNGQV